MAAAALLAMLAGNAGECALPTETPAAGVSTVSTAKTLTDADYRRIELEVATELSAVRTNPPAYAPYLTALLPLFSGNNITRPGGITVQTHEGPAAVREGVSALGAQTAMGSLSLSTGLAAAAHDLAADQGRTGAIGHSASDGADPGTRISRYGAWGISYGENVDYGWFTTGRDVVIDFIVDDGVPGRGHRQNVFDATAKVVGVSCGRHPTYGSVCVIDQAGSFTPK